MSTFESNHIHMNKGNKTCVVCALLMLHAHELAIRYAKYVGYIRLWFPFFFFFFFLHNLSFMKMTCKWKHARSVDFSQNVLREYSEHFLEFIEMMCWIAIPSHLHWFTPKPLYQISQKDLKVYLQRTNTWLSCITVRLNWTRQTCVECSSETRGEKTIHFLRPPSIWHHIILTKLNVRSKNTRRNGKIQHLRLNIDSKPL